MTALPARAALSAALFWALFWALWLASTAAEAHAFLQHAQPAVGGTVQVAPTQISITFTSALEPAFSVISVANQAGVAVDDGNTHADGDSRLSVGVKPLPPGRYLVRWHVVSVDTHRTEGSFHFTVAPPV